MDWSRCLVCGLPFTEPSLEASLLINCVACTVLHGIRQPNKAESLILGTRRLDRQQQDCHKRDQKNNDVWHRSRLKMDAQSGVILPCSAPALPFHLTSGPRHARTEPST